MGDDVTLCAACRHFDRTGTNGFCRRHAPAVGDSPFEVARWPETRAIDGCGDGEPNGDRSSEQRLPCGDCIFWYRPGIGIDPSQRGDHLRAWWQDAGYCRRLAPHPGVDIGRRAFWRVTHRNDHCSEGRPGAGGPS